jgi:hypothetical protein
MHDLTIIVTTINEIINEKKFFVEVIMHQIVDLVQN